MSPLIINNNLFGLWHTLSLSYGVNLPSSLMIVSSNAFVFYTSLLVLVSRYGYLDSSKSKSKSKSNHFKVPLPTHYYPLS